MKIDFLISSLAGGGAEKVVTILSEAFADKGDDVSILSLEQRSQFYKVDEKVRLIRVDSGKKGIVKAFKQYFAVRRAVRDNKDGVLVSFLLRCNLLSAAANIFKKRKLIVCDRNNPLKEHSVFVFKLSCFFYRFASAVVVQTEKIKSFYPKRLQNKIFVIENPLDTVGIDKQVTEFDGKKEKTIISVGRLEKQKDFFTLIKSFSLLEKDFPEYKLKIFGQGPMEREIKDYISSMGLTKKVLLCGQTEKLFYELKKAEVFVLSSFYEGFPNVLCEAMYAGLPCVASDCVSGPSELITDGENGYLFEVGNADQLAEKLRSLLLDGELRKKVGVKAKLSVARLEKDKIYEKWRTVFLK